MTFEFQCPNGHVLEADESLSGQICTCPHCSTSLVIPASSGSTSTPEPPRDHAPPSNAKSDSATPGFYPEFNVGDVGRTTKAVTVNFEGGDTEQLLHIPCPNGHVLDTPLDMLGQDVLCPHCEAQFRLLEKNSVEYQRRQEVEERRKEARANKFWLNFAIIAAIIFIFGLILMVILTS